MNSAQKRLFTVSNILSFLRLVLAPVVACSIMHGRWERSALLFAVGGLTDLFDGYLARAWREQTILGHYLDPIADKVFVLSSLAALAQVGLRALSLPLGFWWFALAREAVIVCGGLVMMSRSARAAIRPTMLGKLTTAGYMVLIGWALLCAARGWAPAKSFFIASRCVFALSAASLVDYCVRGFKALSGAKK